MVRVAQTDERIVVVEMEIGPEPESADPRGGDEGRHAEQPTAVRQGNSNVIVGRPLGTLLGTSVFNRCGAAR